MALPVVGSGAPPRAGMALPSGAGTAGNPPDGEMIPIPSVVTGAVAGAVIGAAVVCIGIVAGPLADSKAIHAKITPPTRVMHEM